jgi:hypothetical protein
MGLPGISGTNGAVTAARTSGPGNMLSYGRSKDKGKPTTLLVSAQQAQSHNSFIH